MDVGCSNKGHCRGDLNPTQHKYLKNAELSHCLVFRFIVSSINMTKVKFGDTASIIEI